MHQLALFPTLLLIATRLPLPGAQLTNCGHCVCDRPGVTCDFGSQSRIKGNIDLTGFAPSGRSLRELGLDPLGFRELYINCKSSLSLRDQRLTRDLLREFANLTRVVIVKCDLVAIDPDALTGLNQLMELDVSYNRLQRLPPGLLLPRSLRALTLSDNPGLSLDPGTFQDVRLERLVLSNCRLAEFPWASLQAIAGLKELTLSQNDIKFVPSAAIKFVTGLSVFYLDDNPLACTCANKWLREKIAWDRVSPPIIKSSKQPKCGSPPVVLDVELSRLAPSDFPCRKPEIRSVDIQLQADSVQLICSALADQPQQGPLMWTYRHQTVFPAMPHGYPSRTYQGTGPTFRQSVRRTLGYEREEYTVTATGEDGQTANFSLTVHWPEGGGGGQQQLATTRQPAKSVGDFGNNNKKSQATTTDGGQGPAEPKDPQQAGAGGADYFSRKQFTLVEMIIAVVGTFMGTSLIFLLSCQFTRWYNKRDKKRWAAGYTTQPYSYNYNSHRPPSHEYDVPRIDLPCLPKQPPPPSVPPPVPLPMPQSQQLAPATAAASQSLLTSTHHHHLQQQQQLLPKPSLTPPSPRSCAELGGDLEFLDYNGQRWMLGTSRLN